jgi:hypothetical protein
VSSKPIGSQTFTDRKRIVELSVVPAVLSTVAVLGFEFRPLSDRTFTGLSSYHSSFHRMTLDYHPPFRYKTNGMKP